MDYESLANLILNGLYWMNRMVRFIFRRSNKAVEDAILRHIASNRDWYSPSQITNEVFRLAIVGDIPFSIVFPAQLNGIKKFSHWLRQLAIEARHKWRMWWKFVPEEKVRAAMLRMWEQGMLDREPAGDERYRMSERVTVQSDQQPHESKHLWIEFFKAVTGPAALLGLLLAYWSSTQQFAHLSRARNQDRFDRAVSWLGSSNPTERLGGVSGLQLFLDKTPTISGVSDPKEASERQRVALLFLVNAVAVERDTTVQSAILDNLSSLSRFDMPSAVLNEALVAARNRNRGILTTLRDRFNERSLENNKSLIEEAVDEAFLGKLNESELLPLKGTAATIAALIRNGAYTSDLTRIYCMGCDFSSDTKPVDLSGVKFDLSYLRDAKFKNVNLVAASFDTAFLIYTDFTGANLRGARLTSSTLVNPPIQAILVKKALWGAYGPIFECADLTDSDFTGSVLFGFYWTEVGNTGYFPRFYKADLTRTNMKSIEVFTAIPKGVLNRLAKTEPQLRVSDLVLGLVEGGAYPILVRGWMGTNDYEIRTLSFGAFTRPIPKEIWPSVYAGLNSLSSGDNLAKAQLPTGLQDFLTANAKVFAKPIISTTCPEKR